MAIDLAVVFFGACLPAPLSSALPMDGDVFILGGWRKADSLGVWRL